MSQPVWSETNRARWTGVRPAIEGDVVSGTTNIANGTATLYTVPANKILLLQAVAAQFNLSVAAAAFGFFRWRDAGLVDKWQFAFFRDTVAISKGMTETFPFPLQIPAAHVLQIHSSYANAWTYGSFAGVLVDE